MNTIKIKFKKLSNEAKTPVRSSELAGGYDLFAVKESFETTNVIYDTDIALEIPQGYVGLIFPRSSIATKTTLSLANSVGVIDPDYRGSLKFIFRNTTLQGGKKYKPGDRIGQILLVERFELDFEEVENLDETKRGSGSYGSTGA